MIVTKKWADVLSIISGKNQKDVANPNGRWVTRWWRRITRGFGYCKYALGIIPLWCIYILAVYFWGTHRPDAYPIIEILWDTKSSIFSSVIIAAITAFITQYGKHKNAFLEQHRVYINVMDACSQLFKDLMRLLCHDVSKEYVPYWPFYSQNLLDQLHDEFSSTCSFDRSSAEYQFVLTSIDEVRRTLTDLGHIINSGTLAEYSSFSVNELVSDCNRALASIERLLLFEDKHPHWDNTLSSDASTFFKLIDLLRAPWRRDLKVKLDVLKAIYKEDKSIADTFYNSAFLDVVDFDFYKNLDDYILQLKNRYRPKIKVTVRRKTNV